MASLRARFSLPLPPTFTLGTVAAQVDLSAPAMPTISNLVSSGTPTYAWTLTDPLGADASALLTGPTTATPTCAALSTWTGAKLCGRWTGTVTVTDSAGSTTKSFGWTVGVSGRMHRETLSFVGQTRDFKVDSSPLDVDGVIFAPTNPGNSQVFRFSSGALEIQPNANNFPYSSASQTAPYVILDLAQINPSYTRTRRCRLQVKITHPSALAQNQQALVGFRGEQAASFAGVRVHGHLITRYHKAVVISTSAESGQSNVNEVIGLVVLVKCGNHYELYTAAAGSDYLEEGDAGLTLRKIFSTDNEPGDTDLYDGGESLLIGSPNNGSTGVPDILRFSGIRLDVEV